ncbi:hypothetical protein Ahia01_000906100, partial [Argonauta hians]
MDYIYLAVVVVVAGLLVLPGFEPTTFVDAGTSKFQYEAGYVYRYDYEATTTTGVSGAGNGGVTLHYTATLEFESHSKCEMTLKMTNVQVKTQSFSADRRSSSTFAEDLMRKPLRFSFQDGRVAAVCPGGGGEGESEEARWAVNVKRGILSLFQNSADSWTRSVNLTETDISGQCETHYRVEEENTRSTVTFSKHKNLLSCLHREHFNIQHTPYDSFSV